MKKQNRRKFLGDSMKLASTALVLGSIPSVFAKDQNQESLHATHKPKITNVANKSQEAVRNVAKNPFGLVYENAISKNGKGKVNIQQVSYKTRGLKAVANVYLPPNFTSSGKYPAIVVAHPNGGVKEQVAGLYAQNLAQMGYVTLAFDALYQGASEGMPRNVDTPTNRIEDIYAAIDFISTFEGVDNNRLGILGICGGGGYTLKAAQTDKRLKAIATLSMFNSGLVRRNGFLDSQISSIQTRLEEASKARAKQVLGEILYTGAAPVKLSQPELAKIDTDLYREGAIYYGDTHAHPNSSFAYTTASLLELMSFDALNQIELINKPLLLMVGDKADTAYMSEQAYKRASGTDTKELFRLQDSTHIQTYFKPNVVAQALGKLEEFYKQYV